MSYKYQRVRERLRQAVQNGELAGKLPGERELARRYNANAKTINKALTDLATEGLLVRHVGRGTFVARDTSIPNGPAAPPRAQSFGYLVSTEASGACGSMLYRQTRQLLDQRGHRLEELVLQPGPNGELSGRDLRADRLRAFDGLVLCAVRPSEDLLANVTRRHLPLVMINNHHPQVRTAAVMSDFSQGAFELCQHLIQLGHAHIRLVIDPSLMPAASAAEGGYQAAMYRYAKEPGPAMYPDGRLVATPSAPGSDGNPPTAVICIGIGAASIMLESAEAHAGLSLCCMLEPGESLGEDRNLTTYDVDPRDLAHWTAELLLSASPARWQCVAIVPGRLTARGATTPPANPANVHTPRASAC